MINCENKDDALLLLLLLFNTITSQPLWSSFWVFYFIRLYSLLRWKVDFRELGEKKNNLDAIFPQNAQAACELVSSQDWFVSGRYSVYKS